MSSAHVGSTWRRSAFDRARPLETPHAFDSDPAAPSIVEIVPLAGTPVSVHASENRVLMALGKQGVQYVNW